MVYDGPNRTFRFYRNGELQGTVNLPNNLPSYNLGTNNLPLRIGTESWLPSLLDIHFIGVINEVRIWNIARSYQELFYYGDRTIEGPIPSGLIAYYRFNSLVNVANPGQWNATIMGQAAVGSSGCQYVVTGSNCIPAVPRMISTTQTEQASKFKIAISPNPVDDIADLTFHSESGGISHFQVYDSGGRLVWSKVANVNKGANRLALNGLRKLAQGVYFLRVYIDGRPYSLGFIKS